MTSREGELALNAGFFSVDVREFEVAVQSGDLETGLYFYRGEFLDRFFTPDAPKFETWADDQRSRLREEAIEAALRLVKSYDERGEYLAAVERARWAVRAAPADESVLRQLLRLLDAHGDRTVALQEFETFRGRLVSDFGTEPSQETLALVERIRETLRIAESDSSEAGSESSAEMAADVDTRDTLMERLRPPWAERYEVQRKIGSGGMATVYLARDLRDERLVAIKVLRPEVADLVGTERFLREIRIGASLQHPNVLPLYESGEADGLPYYVMPYVSGGSLKDRLKREKQLPIDEALRITQEVASALGAAHDRGILHRDIKPANILLDEGTPLVADFGIARALSEVGEDKLTVSGIALGTPGYMSPEQATATPEVDHRTDVYSLACVLHEMLTGEMVFTGSSARAIVAKHVAVAPTPVRALRPRVPLGVEQAILCALEKTPVDRCSTVQEFASALEEGALAEPTPPTPWDSLRDKALRRPVAAGLVGALVAVGVAYGSIALFTEQAPPAATSSIATPVLGILPFTEVSPSGELGWMASALEARLEHALSSVPGLTLRSRQALATYQRRDVPADSLGSLLGIDFFVQGQVEGTPDAMSLLIQLIESSSSTVVGTGTAPLPAGDPIPLVESVTRTVEEILRPAVGREVRVGEWLEGTSSQLAFELRYRAEERIQAAEALLSSDPHAALRELQAAESLLAQAQASDPEWVEAPLTRSRVADRSTIALILSASPDYGDQVRTAIEGGIVQAEAALSIEPDSPEALAQRGRLRWRRHALLGEAPLSESEWVSGAESDLRRAIEGDPSLAVAAATLSELLFEGGAYAEAQRFAEHAYEVDAYLDDTSVIVNRIARAAFEMEQDQAALEWCQEGIRRFPSEPMHHACSLEVMAWGAGSADPDTAWRHYDRLISTGADVDDRPLRRYFLVALAAVLARNNLADSAQALIRQARAWEASDSPLDMGPLIWESGAYFRLGDDDQATALYQQYVDSNPERAQDLANRRILRGFPLLSFDETVVPIR